MHLLKILPAILLYTSISHSFQKVETKIASAKSSSSSTVSYMHGGASDDIWFSEVILTQNKLKIKDAAAKTDTVNELQWLNIWDLPSKWFIELGVGGSNTKVNKLRTGHIDFTFGKVNEEYFFSNWSITLGSNSIKQTEGLTAGADELHLRQSKTGFQLGFNPAEWMGISIHLSKYKYNKNIDQQLTLLQSAAAAQTYGTAFSDQLSTLIDRDCGVSFDFRFSDAWKLSFNTAQTQDASEARVKGQIFSAELYNEINSDWDASLTLGSNRYGSTNTTPSASYSYVGLAASYNW